MRHSRLIGMSCPLCAVGTVRAATVRVVRVPFRELDDVAVPAGVPIPTCDHFDCQHMWLDADSSRLLQDVLRREYCRRVGH